MTDVSRALHDLSPVHLVGIGGAGMSALATVMLQRGLVVTGSDIKASRNLAALEALGARITIGHAADNVAEAATIVVSSAIRAANVELVAAQERGIPVLHRAQMLASLMRGHRGVAVSGTHGKTTTTSMVALLFQHANLEPTFLIGGDLNESGTNAYAGSGAWVVAEADESDGSFLWLSPEIAVVTNIEADHLDHYRDEEEIRETFLAFMRNTPEDGLIVACADDAGVNEVIGRAGRRVATYGLERGTWRAEERRSLGNTQSFKVRRDGELVGEVTLAAPGEHNARNALAALAVADAAGISFDDSAAALAQYQGVQRRFQHRGSIAGVTVVDDYAHNPTKVRAAISAAREVAEGRVVAIFQPHLYSRTLHLGDELGAALSGADVVVVMDVYGAREEPQPGVTGKLVVDGVLAARPRSRVAYLPRRSDVTPYIQSRARTGDLVLTVGAGDVTTLGEEILRGLAARASSGRSGGVS